MLNIGFDCNGTECQTWTGCVYKEDAPKTLKRALEDLSVLEETANKAEKEYEAAPMDAGKEKAFDEAYKAEFDAFIAVSDLIVKMTDGRIDEKTAREMVQTKRAEILRLIA